MTKFAEIVAKYGTDKRAHGYMELYEELFTPMMGSWLHLLEIGVWKGESLRMWAEIFPDSNIYGVDSDPACAQHEDLLSNIVVTVCDATVKLDMHGVDDNCGPFDIIIDDGSHRPEDYIATYETMWPLLLSGGYYCIEDLNVSSASELEPTAKPWLGDLLFGYLTATNPEIERIWLRSELLVMRKA